MINVIFIIIVTILSYFILLIRIMILLSFHPIFIGVLMLLLCLFIRRLMSLITHSWLSFLLFYLISGGILILLIYMSCFRFNPIFKKRFFFLLAIIASVLLVHNHNAFVIKKTFTNMIVHEAGARLSYTTNIRIFIIISFLIFLCFFNIRKIITSISFSIRKFYLRSNTRTANSCLY